MTTLYNIIKSLQTTQGNIAKQAILDDNKDNELLKQYMKAVFDPAISYYQTKLPKVGAVGDEEFGLGDIKFLTDELAGRKVTGNNALAALGGWLSVLDAEAQELIGYIIRRKIDKANVGETMVLKTWPNLFFVPPYMRCKSMDKKVKEHYSKLPGFYVQTKRDGSFAYLQKTLEGASKAITRQGSLYPTWFTERVTKGIPNGFVLVGEMEVYSYHTAGEAVLLDRKTGNGLLNSVLQGAEESDFEGYDFRYVAWDILTEEEFILGKSDRKYEDRLRKLATGTLYETGHITLVSTYRPQSIAEANQIHLDHISKGLEGTVWKDPSGVWRDTSSGTMDQVKNKVVFEAEYEIIGCYEGEGKAAGMLGGISVKTSCGKLVSNCGSGFSDKQRNEFWEIRESLLGKIVTIEANDIIDSKNKDTLSLSLPVFIEIRDDKREADSLERVLEQLEAVKQGKS